MPGIKPQTEKLIIYDDENQELKRTAEEVTGMLQVYSLPSENITSLKISNLESEWSTLQCDSFKLIFFVSIETELFHKSVKKIIRPENDNILVLLIYSSEKLKFVEKTIKDIKKAAKKANKNISFEKLLQVERKIVKVLDLKVTLSWWPVMLQFLYGGHFNRQANGHRREIGVSYVFNQADEKQTSWFSDQRHILEGQFETKCAKMSPHPSFSEAERYAKASECVVIYLYSNDLANNHGHLTEEQKHLLQWSQNKCKVLVFVNKLNTKCHSRVTKDTDNRLKLTGEGELVYWMKLLQSLGLVKVQARQDKTFYSRTKDQVIPVHFKPREDRPMTTRSGYKGVNIADLDGIEPTPVLGDSLRENKYQMLHEVCYCYDSHGHDFTNSYVDHVTTSCACLLL